MRVLCCACCLALLVSAQGQATDGDCANWDLDIFAPPTQTWCYMRMYRCADHYSSPDLSNYNAGDLTWAAGGKKLGAHTCAPHGKYLQVWRVKVKRDLMKKKPPFTQCKNNNCGCGLTGRCGKKKPAVNFGWRYKFPGKLTENSKRQFSLPKGSRKDQWEDLCLERVILTDCVKKLTYNENNMKSASAIFKKNIFDAPTAGCRSLTPIKLCKPSMLQAQEPSKKQEEQECQAQEEEAEKVAETADEVEEENLCKANLASEEAEQVEDGEEDPFQVEDDLGSDQCVDCAGSDFLASIRKLSIPSEAIHRRDGATFYTIVSSLSDDESVVQASRRYKEFDMLRRELTLVPSDSNFPKKQVSDSACTLVSSLQSCVEDRRLGLEAYLNRALHQFTQTADKEKYLQAGWLAKFLTKQNGDEGNETDDEDVDDFQPEDIGEPAAQVSEESLVKVTHDLDALIKEYYDSNMGVAFTMVRSTSWGRSWGLASRPAGKTRFVSIMTHKTDMATFEGDAYGLVFHITPEKGFWKHFLAIKSGKNAGGIVGGPGDGGSHTAPSNTVLPGSIGKDYAWFTSEKKAILAKYNTVYKIRDYNEFIVMGTSKPALAGILHYTRSRKHKPSDGQMCSTLRSVRGGKWPIYAYDRTVPSLSIERYLNC